MIAMIVWQVWSRVVAFAGESGRPGTAFIVDRGDRSYLVTARHLCLPDENEEQVTITHAWTEGGRSSSSIMRRVDPSELGGDVAIFEMPKSLLGDIGSEVPVMSNGIVFTQDCYIMGFPYGLSTPVGPQARIPIVKKGIIAGRTSDASGIPQFLVDVIANPGFSGGPLVWFRSDGQPAFGGVVVQNIMAPAYDPALNQSHRHDVPAGIALATDADAMLTVLETLPEGT
jgi:S1-C subfamily serine protease